MNSTKSVVAAVRIAARPSPLQPEAARLARSRHRFEASPRHIFRSRLSCTRGTSLRTFHTSSTRKAAAATKPEASNPAMAFPCLDAIESKSATLEARSLSSGPEPSIPAGLRYSIGVRILYYLIGVEYCQNSILHTRPGAR